MSKSDKLQASAQVNKDSKAESQFYLKLKTVDGQVYYEPTDRPKIHDIVYQRNINGDYIAVAWTKQMAHNMPCQGRPALSVRGAQAAA